MGGNPSKKVVRCPADKENQAGNRESCSFPMQSVSNSCLWSDHFTMPVHPLFLRLLWEFVLTCSSSLPEITLVPAPLPGHPKWSSQDLDGSLQARWWMVWSNRIARTTKVQQLAMRRKRQPRRNLPVKWGMAPSSSPRPSQRGRTVSSSPDVTRDGNGDAGLASLVCAGFLGHCCFYLWCFWGCLPSKISPSDDTILRFNGSGACSQYFWDRLKCCCHLWDMFFVIQVFGMILAEMWNFNLFRKKTWCFDHTNWISGELEWCEVDQWRNGEGIWFAEAPVDCSALTEY